MCNNKRDMPYQTFSILDKTHNLEALCQAPNASTKKENDRGPPSLSLNKKAVPSRIMGNICSA